MAKIISIETPSLGDRSYLVHDGTTAFVVDPQRDIDRVLDIAERERVRVTHVLETHIHNDYVTGGAAPVAATGAAYLVNEDDPVHFVRTPVKDGEAVPVGERLLLRAIGTPGHTFTHLSYALEEHGRPVAVFTGGSLLYGASGRPDLLGAEHTDELVRLQYRSARRLADELPDAVEVFPTHGFGSFCSTGESEVSESTIGQEAASNPALTDTEEAYVQELLAGLDAFPAYYARTGERNLSGPEPPDLTPPQRAQPEELGRRIAAGEWVVDLRERAAFAAGHAPGTLSFGIDGSFSTYVGWLIAWGTPVTLLARTADDVAQGQRELARIGIDRPAAAATGGPPDWAVGDLDSFPRATFADLAEVLQHRSVVVLDVRRHQEFDEARIEGAVNLPIHELPRRLGDVPAGEVWAHCASGYRATIAGSFLAAVGRRVVVVDDTFDRAGPAGLLLADDGRVTPRGLS